MRVVDVVLVVVVTLVWGVAFVATRVGLDTFSPPPLTAIRFVIAALPVLVLPRPALAWSVLAPVGLTLFAGQFLFQFFGIAAGTPVGIAAVIVHAQALFTIAFAAVLLGERPTPREWLGSMLALAGLALIALTIGGDLAPLGFALTLLSPVSFGLGNVLLKRLGTADMPSLIAWLSLVPPLPALALSAALDGFDGLPRALARAAWPGLAAALYLGLVFGERFGSLRLAGMALVLAGLAVIVAPGARPGVGRSRAPGLLWHRGVRPARASDGKERR